MDQELEERAETNPLISKLVACIPLSAEDRRVAELLCADRRTR
ncbi:hypothetical protein J2Y58_003976 [Sphingomonas sp. BE138]|nr:hypothetical protein [Sphingomonas sp. BE138]MDR6790593.1 hypothetical protein [Sphingomonas sp. BE138]